MPFPTSAPDESALEELLSQPTPALVEAMRSTPGDLLILGASGKMGPSLARLAKRASDEAGGARRIVAAARFSNQDQFADFQSRGIEARRCDLFQAADVARLPDVPNVIYMVGQKFGTSHDEARTWAVNAFLPGIVAKRFKKSRIVAFSTGNVYPLTPTRSSGPRETDPTGPIGEYAQSALARERVLTHFSTTLSIPMAILRLNYAIEPRYGVLRDIADRVWAAAPVDVSMAQVNVIWQRDANAFALQALGHCTVPPLVLNLAGTPAVTVRQLADAFASRWNRGVRCTGNEAHTALLSDATTMVELFGRPQTTVADMIDHVASWVERGGRSLGKATKFEIRDGKY